MQDRFDNFAERNGAAVAAASYAVDGREYRQCLSAASGGSGILVDNPGGGLCWLYAGYTALVGSGAISTEEVPNGEPDLAAAELAVGVGPEREEGSVGRERSCAVLDQLLCFA